MAEITEEQKVAKRTLKTFGWASFLHDMGADIVFSVWPFFITQVLHAPVSALGWIDGLGDAIVSVSQAVSGYWSDRIKKRKIFVWIGYGLGGLARIGYALAPVWGWLIPFRMLDRSGKMRGSPRDAIVSDLSSPANRGRNFGYLRMMDNSGAIVGILIAMFCLSYLGYRTMFLLAAIPSILAAVLILKNVPERRVPEVKIYKGLRFRDLSRDLKLYFFASALFILGSFSYSFLLLYAKDAGFNIIAVPALYLLFTVAAAATSLPFGKMADNWGRKPTLFVSLGLWIVSLLLFASGSLPAIVLAFAVYGLHLGSLGPVQKAITAELAPKDFVASIMGSYQMVMGLCALPASVIAGYLWGMFGPTVPLLFSLAVTLVALVVLAVVRVDPK